MSNGYIYIWKRVFVFVCVYVSPAGSTGLLDFLLLFVHATTFRHLRLIRSLCGFLFISGIFFLSPSLSLLSLCVCVYSSANLFGCFSSARPCMSLRLTQTCICICTLVSLFLVRFSSNLQAEWGKENAIKRISKCSVKYVYRLFNNTFWTNTAPNPSSNFLLFI